jgi:hypothetical protein
LRGHVARDVCGNRGVEDGDVLLVRGVVAQDVDNDVAAVECAGEVGCGGSVCYGYSRAGDLGLVCCLLACYETDVEFSGREECLYDNSSETTCSLSDT